MRSNRFSRREVLKGAAALAASTVFASAAARRRAAGDRVTPALIEAAKKEGKVVYYTSIDLPLAEKIAKAFEAKYPGIAVRVERTGAERVFQRIGQEYAQQHPRGRRGELVGRRRTSSSGSATGCWRPSCPRTWPSSIRPSTRTRTACSRASASG